MHMQNLFMSLIFKKLFTFTHMGKKFHESKQDNIVNADYRKYDGTLKMVIACDSVNRKRFTEFLEQLREKEMIFYGMHVAQSALMTCLIHLDTLDEVHFIDAENGGYAIATKQMKKQIANSMA